MNHTELCRYVLSPKRSDRFLPKYHQIRRESIHPHHFLKDILNYFPQVVYIFCGNKTQNVIP